MRISAITPNYQAYRNNNYKKTNFVSTPTFKSSREDEEWNNGLRYLNSKTTQIYQGFSLEKFKSEAKDMTIKYMCMGLNGVGLMQIANEDLPVLLGRYYDKCDTKDKIGLCMVMGEPVGEVADMDEIYEVKIFVDTPERIDRIFQNGASYTGMN